MSPAAPSTKLAPRLLLRAQASVIVIACVFACFSVSSCARPAPKPASAAAAKAPAPVAGPPPLALVPVDVARTALVASFVLPSLDRSLVNGVALLKKAAPLPLDPAGVRDMLLAQAGFRPGDRPTPGLVSAAGRRVGRGQPARVAGHRLQLCGAVSGRCHGVAHCPGAQGRSARRGHSDRERHGRSGLVLADGQAGGVRRHR